MSRNEAHFRTDKREKIVFLYGVIAPSSANFAANIRLFLRIAKKRGASQSLAPLSCLLAESFRRIRIGGAAVASRSFRKGSLLRFAIVKSHLLFTSLPRSRRLRRCRCWSHRWTAGRWGCRPGSLHRDLAGRLAAVRCTYPARRPAKRR